jgi:hypothetical protein
VSEAMKLVPYDDPEPRTGSAGDWWALGKLESSVRNADGSLRTFGVEVGISLTPHGDYLHCEDEYWRLVAEKLPVIAKQVAAGV